MPPRKPSIVKTFIYLVFTKENNHHFIHELSHKRKGKPKQQTDSYFGIYLLLENE